MGRVGLVSLDNDISSYNNRNRLEYNNYLYNLSNNDEERKLALLITKSIVIKVIENELSPKQKLILIDYYKNNKTIYEIAEKQGVTHSAISKNLKNSIGIIRKYMSCYNLAISQTVNFISDKY